jgi:sulfatase maturation enzyme AslB (radical SAM superfamily)
VVLPPGTIGFCCVAHEGGPVSDDKNVRMKVPHASLDQAWNSNYYKDIRKRMLNGEEVQACRLCYYQESIGKDSYRNMHNTEWMRKSGAEIKRRIEYSEENNFEVDQGALYLDLRLGNTCNLKCRMCNPYNSSKIAAETETLLKVDEKFKTVYNRHHGDRVYKIPKWQEDPDFWEGVYKQLPSLRKIYLTGGEPTLIKKNYEFLKKCIETGHSKHIFLMFNINCTTLTEEFLSYLKHFEFVLINASIDGLGEVNEYIRGSSNWDLIDKNFERLLSVKGPVRVGVTPTIQIYNILNLDSLLGYIRDKSDQASRTVDLDFLYVTDPAYLDIRILPDSIKEKAAERLEAFAATSSKYVNKNPNLKNSLGSLLRALKINAGSRQDLLNDFADYTRSLDQFRNENFSRSLPELNQLLSEAGVHI